MRKWHEYDINVPDVLIFFLAFTLKFADYFIFSDYYFLLCAFPTRLLHTQASFLGINIERLNPDEPI